MYWFMLVCYFINYNLCYKSKVIVIKDDYYDKFRWYLYCLNIYYIFFYEGVWKVLNYVFN